MKVQSNVSYSDHTSGVTLMCWTDVCVHALQNLTSHAWCKLDMGINADIPHARGEPIMRLQTSNNTTKLKVNVAFSYSRAGRTILISHTKEITSKKKGGSECRWWSVFVGNFPPWLTEKQSVMTVTQHRVRNTVTQTRRQKPINWSETGVGTEHGVSNPKPEKYHMTEADRDWKVSQTLKHVCY